MPSEAEDPSPGPRRSIRLLANKQGEIESPVKIGGTAAALAFPIALGRMAKTAAATAVKKEVTKDLNKLLGNKTT
jgi:bifunctional N-acetylglucosamine-1-phosphate-uridyltransferase/glucosamine-1-phosphate-acetyltransferase GlmU-like protein